MHGFLTEGVRALSRIGILPGAAVRKPDGHILGTVWDELEVDGSRDRLRVVVKNPNEV
jgi:hypothetical protein